MISITFNGEPRQLPAAMPLRDALAALNASGDFAAALNGQFVPRSRYAEQNIQAGDQLDLLSPVAGG
ncbi:sulfur carrier protein ThiS [Simiduia agarivorans]|uniref:Thiamine biosynthesis protein ThiS n=1 Tax=Simiduia agarivorans (strain DSM 21679 / JCM 13881 / BCRC 17597 / SA1) TaxID=1117647 RepID=K4KPK4_SIMAS|nr:sulfur carrier protein ThiS [Simiduia agarivorans]AFV00977.1 thiamine biosynthesis protein ThiS [Simiduia agarivorans SA1 = DSM 21679]